MFIAQDTVYINITGTRILTLNTTNNGLEWNFLILIWKIRNKTLFVVRVAFFFVSLSSFEHRSKNKNAREKANYERSFAVINFTLPHLAVGFFLHLSFLLFTYVVGDYYFALNHSFDHHMNYEQWTVFLYEYVSAYSIFIQFIFYLPRHNWH